MFAINFENKISKNPISSFSKQQSIILNSSTIKQRGLNIGDTIPLSDGVSNEKYNDSKAIISSTFAQ